MNTPITHIESNLNLILTGFMGTGKTTIGKLVAERLGRRFLDMDQIIMIRTGRTVPELFRTVGEERFRALEAELCKEFSPPQGIVIATGGGALVSEANYRTITSQGNVVVCLTASFEALLPRLVASRERPLAQNSQAVAELYRRREQAYRKIRIQLDTSNLEPTTIATAVIHLFDREVERHGLSTQVHNPSGVYDILCARNLLPKMRYLLADYRLDGRIVVVTDENVAPLYGESLAASLPNASLVTFPAGEVHKNLETINTLYAAFIEMGLDRSGVVIALGGGVVGDAAGYAAATYMRGVRLVQIPTSLLAMVDSSVGGKVGVDLPQGKNLVGAFKQPEMVLIDPNVLHTLDPVELRCGLAEVIKHGLIGDPGLLEHLDDIAAGDPTWLRRTIQVKVDIVERDPYEHGERAHLNLGHTFAHAIEQVSGYAWRHGEAVGLGLVAATRLSEALCNFSGAAQVESLVQAQGLPTRWRGFDPEALWQTMHTDKKWQSGQSRFVVLEAPGQPRIVRGVPREQVIDILKSLEE
ncbi:MAG: 3-dehydroquinate synthase [Anaerolineae bacterium]|nr:3-dehydroquinate synthase [Anaerolineae bacterium]